MGDENKVELSVLSDFRKIIADLEALQKKASGVSDNVKRAGDELDKNLTKATKKTEKNFEHMRDLGRRTADQLRGYFSSMANQVSAALKSVQKDIGLKQVMLDAGKGAVDLYDTLRKVGTQLGLNTRHLADFQQLAMKAMAGFSQQDIARTLEGVSHTQVRGESNVLAYGTTASQLAEAGGNQGQSGAIAQALAEVLKQRGMDQNNVTEMAKVAADAGKVLKATGSNPLETLRSWSGAYGGMEDDTQRKKLGSNAMRNFSAVDAVVPGVMALVGTLTKGKLENLPKYAQGAAGMITDQGIDADKFEKFYAGVSGRIGFDKGASLQTSGFSAEEAQTMIKMHEMMPQIRAAQAAANAGGGTLAQQAEDSRGLRENAGMIKNRTVGVVGGAIAPGVEKLNKFIGGFAKSDTQSIAAMATAYAGAGLAAGGLSMLAKKVGVGGAAASVPESAVKAGIIEQLTGKDTIPVWVVNFGEMENGGKPGLAEKTLSSIPVVGPVIGALAGVAVGAALSSPNITETNKQADGVSKKISDSLDAQHRKLLDEARQRREANAIAKTANELTRDGQKAGVRGKTDVKPRSAP